MDINNPNVPLLIDHAKVAKGFLDAAQTPGRPKDEQIAYMMFSQCNALLALHGVLCDIRDLTKLSSE
jgi:hypothetical protein